jgi:hypothetical protein
MNQKRWVHSLLLIAIGCFILSACTINVERNPDGSLSAEVNLPESTIQTEIHLALNDPLITDLEADLHQGYISVSAERRRVFGDESDTLTFRLDLGTEDGHLTALISNAKVNDESVDQAVVNVWNERLANQLEKAGKRNPDSSLQSVAISENALTFVWRIETPRSRGD